MHEAIFVVGWSGLRLDARIYQKEEHDMEQRVPLPYYGPSPEVHDAYTGILDRKGGIMTRHDNTIPLNDAIMKRLIWGPLDHSTLLRGVYNGRFCWQWCGKPKPDEYVEIISMGTSRLIKDWPSVRRIFDSKVQIGSIVTVWCYGHSQLENGDTYFHIAVKV